MAKISIKNWGKFQHYKNRRPPWIKLYKDLIDDPDWHSLKGEDAKYLIMIWLIASEAEDGQLPPIKKLSFRLRLPEDITNQLLTRLSNWLVHDDSNLIANCYRDALPEAETETETETENKAEPPPVDNSLKTEIQDLKNSLFLSKKLTDDKPIHKAWGKFHKENNVGNKNNHIPEWIYREILYRIRDGDIKNLYPYFYAALPDLYS